MSAGDRRKSQARTLLPMVAGAQCCMRCQKKRSSCVQSDLPPALSPCSPLTATSVPKPDWLCLVGTSHKLHTSFPKDFGSPNTSELSRALPCLQLPLALPRPAQQQH